MTFYDEIQKKIIECLGKTRIDKNPLWISYNLQQHKVKGYEVRKILDVVKKGDVIFSYHAGYVTTILMPGYWTHVGLYVGDGKMVHAIWKGVTSEDILDFCRSDSICVKRTNIVDREIDSICEKAIDLSDDGIKYDYKFEENNGMFYCTELIDYLFDGIFHSEYKTVAGQKRLTPDGLFKSDKLHEVLLIKH